MTMKTEENNNNSNTFENKEKFPTSFKILLIKIPKKINMVRGYIPDFHPNQMGISTLDTQNQFA